MMVANGVTRTQLMFWKTVSSLDIKDNRANPSKTTFSIHAMDRTKDPESALNSRRNGRGLGGISIGRTSHAKLYATIGAELDGQDAGPFSPRRGIITAEIGRPPLSQVVLEIGVVPSMRDGLVANTIGASKVCGHGDYTAIAAFDDFRTAQVVSSVCLKNKHAFVETIKRLDGPGKVPGVWSTADGRIAQGSIHQLPEAGQFVSARGFGGRCRGRRQGCLRGWQVKGLCG